MALQGAILGGLFDVFAGREANKANLEATNRQIASDQARQEKALGALTGSDPFQSTAREGEGFKTTFGPAGVHAGETRNIETLGDIDRARTVNTALQDFKFNVPTLADARGIVNKDQALQQEAFIEPGLNKILKMRARTPGADLQMPGSQFEGDTVRALKEFAAQNRLGGETQALDLFGKSNLADLQTLQQVIAANQAQGPKAPGFVSPNVGPQAANVVASIKPAAQPVDLASTLPFAAGGSVIKQMQQEEYTDKILDALRNRGLGNTGSGVFR